MVTRLVFTHVYVCIYIHHLVKREILSVPINVFVSTYMNRSEKLNAR